MAFNQTAVNENVLVLPLTSLPSMSWACRARYSASSLSRTTPLAGHLRGDRWAPNRDSAGHIVISMGGHIPADSHLSRLGRVGSRRPVSHKSSLFAHLCPLTPSRRHATVALPYAPAPFW